MSSCCLRPEGVDKFAGSELSNVMQSACRWTSELSRILRIFYKLRRMPRVARCTLHAASVLSLSLSLLSSLLYSFSAFLSKFARIFKLLRSFYVRRHSLKATLDPHSPFARLPLRSRALLALSPGPGIAGGLCSCINVTSTYVNYKIKLLRKVI